MGLMSDRKISGGRSTKSTVLGSVEPLPEEEQKELAKKLAKERAIRSLDSLLAYSDHDTQFASVLCKKVADKFGPDDRLSALLLKRLRADRTGHPKGPNKKWDYARYMVLLVHYHFLKLQQPRVQALTQLAEMEGLSGNNASKKIADRITEARKIVGDDDLPEIIRSPVKNNRRD